MKKQIVILLFICLSSLNADTKTGKNKMGEFNNINSSGEWVKVLDDDFSGDWRQKWTLDGKNATLKNTADGLDFASGPLEGKDESHAVLWTKDIFKGDIKIEYDFTRMDNATKYVNILYLHASGSGKGKFSEDISKWSELRKIASMKMYFNHMNLYHISYAAFKNDNDDPGKDYIRARRYIPETDKGLAQTDLLPDNFNTGFFDKGVKHHITVIKKDDDLYMKVSNPNQEKVYHWKTNTAPPVKEGRIGLRQMLTRRSIYKNFKVYSIKK